MRNHAFAKALKKNNVVDEAYFGLVYHDENTSIKKEWDKYKDSCVDSEKQYLFEIKASDLMSCTTDETHRKYLTDRYLL